MKKLLILPVIVASILVSCNDYHSTSPSSKASKLTFATQGLADSIGYHHNGALDYFFAHTPPGFDTLSLSLQIHLSDSLGCIYLSAQNILISLPTQQVLEDTMVAIFNRNSGTFNGASYYSDFKSNSTLTSSMTARDLAYADSINSYLSGSFSGMTRVQIYDAVSTRADSLLGSFKSVSLDSTEGEVAIPMLNVMKSSAQYWKAYENIHGPNPTVSSPFILTADCVGYLGGWGVAVIKEIGANGHLDVGNSTGRMWAGVGGAWLASCGSFLR